MYRKALGLILLFSSICNADQAFVSYGLGVGKSAINSSTETGAITLGYDREIWDGFYWQYSGGYWQDRTVARGRKSSLFLSTGPGLLIELGPVEFRSGWGLAFISSPDIYLGGSFPQFQGDLGVGLRGKYGNGIALKFNHISSAGFCSPNTGRDFLLIELSQKW